MRYLEAAKDAGGEEKEGGGRVTSKPWPLLNLDKNPTASSFPLRSLNQ